MEWIAQTINEFSAARGLEQLRFELDSVLELELPSGELVGFSYLPELPYQEMLVYISAPLLFDPLRQLETALRLSNGRYNPYGPAQPVIRNDRLVIAMRLPVRAFDLPLLDQTVSSLLEIQGKAAAA
jgi:hypothetical protein